MEQFIADNYLLLTLLTLWSLPWQGVSLWMAARRNHMYWFLALLVLNTVGILPIIYIFFVGNKIEVTSEQRVEKE